MLAAVLALSRKLTTHWRVELANMTNLDIFLQTSIRWQLTLKAFTEMLVLLKHDIDGTDYRMTHYVY